MNRLIRSLIWIGVAALVMLSPRGHLHATGGYTVDDLGALGGSQSFGYDINSQGQVTGEANYTGDVNSYAFLYSNGAMTNLGVPPLSATSGGTNSAGWAINAVGDVAGIYLYCPLGLCQPVQHPILYHHGSPIDIGLGFGGAAVAINDAGQVAGSLNVPGGTDLFLYSNGVTTDLGTLPNLPDASPYAINSSGEIVGFSTKPYPNYLPYAFLYTQSNGMIPLTPYGGGAYAINDAGQVTGFAYTADGITYHAFIYDHGSMTDLGTLAGFSYSASWGFAINAHGQVAGISDTSDGGSHAFLYSNGGMSDLGTLGGSYSWPGNDFYVHAINGPGQVVGTSYLADNRTKHAFLSSGGVMADLNSLIPADSGWTLEVANAINDSGQITGYGYINGQRHAFLLTPTRTAAPPTIAKAFGASTIIVGNNTTLTFTLGNANSTALSGLAFTDPLPGGMVVANPNGLTSSCGGTLTGTPGSTSIALSGGSIAANGTCVISVTVAGVSAGSWTNVTGNVTSTEGGAGGQATASLMITAPLPPTIAKAFGAASIPLGTNTTLTFTLTNPNSTALSGVGFADSLPDGIIVATPNGLTGSCGGAVNAPTGSNFVVLTGGSIAASGTCVISVTVTGVSVGSWTNVTGKVASTEGGTGGTATANLQVSAPLPGCQGTLKSAYAQQYGGLNHAASALGFPSVSALVNYVAQVCGG